ncbi:MAG: hypothetical protein ACOC0P_02125 [Planctomycetota bacterium]
MSNGSPFQVFTAGRSRYLQHAGSVYRYVSSRPSWISRAAAFAFLFVVVLPVAVLVLLAVLLAVSVFAVLALANALTLPLRDAVQRLFSGSSPDRSRRRRPRRIMMWSTNEAARKAAEQQANARYQRYGSPPGPRPAADGVDVDSGGGIGGTGGPTGGAASGGDRPESRSRGSTPSSDAEGRQNVTVRRPRGM